LNTRYLFHTEIRDRIGDLISLSENKGKDPMEPDDFDADSTNEDAFENISLKLMLLTLLVIEQISSLSQIY
jgi:hypothetical protein